MRTKCVLFVFAAFFFMAADAQVNANDSLALVDLYKSTAGKKWYHHDNWLTTQPVSGWYGISTTGNRVTTISLGNNNLTGSIPQSIGNLDALKGLFLNRNFFSDTLSASLGRLTALESLNLASCSNIHGTIPAAIGNLHSLTSLDLSDNYLTGSIPDSLFNCTQLNFLSLWDNQLTGGLSPLFAKLTRLATLRLSYNLLSGRVKDIFAKEAPLVELDLGSNRLSGPFPGYLARYTQLVTFILGRNNFDGHLPASISNLAQLSYFDVSKNRLSGNVPLSLFSLPVIGGIILDNNELTIDDNPPYTGSQNTGSLVTLYKNRFTFNGLEYLVQKFQEIGYRPQAQLAIHVHGSQLAVSAGGTLSNNTYNWFKVGRAKPVSMAGDSLFQPTESGQYYAKIRNAVVPLLTLLTDTVTYTVPQPQPVVSVSPNPARGMIAIHGLDEKNTVVITVADMSGYVWMRTVSREQAEIKMNVSRLKPGNYLVTVSDGKEGKTVQLVKE